MKISFGAGSYDNNARLKERLDAIVSEFESKFGIEKKFNDPGERLNSIIVSIYNQTGKQVVILIDEYDKPILDALYTEFEEQNRQELRNFYSPLKDSNKYIRFLFIIGITKVSHVNIFSGLNQFDDISLNKVFCTLCGISDAELDKYFGPEIEKLAKDQELTVQEAKKNLQKCMMAIMLSSRFSCYLTFCALKLFIYHLLEAFL